MSRTILVLAIVIGAATAEAAMIPGSQDKIPLVDHSPVLYRYSTGKIHWGFHSSVHLLNEFVGSPGGSGTLTRGPYAGCDVTGWHAQDFTTTFDAVGHGTVTTFFNCRGTLREDVQFFIEGFDFSGPFAPGSYPGQKLLKGSGGAVLRVRLVPEPFSVASIVAGLLGLGILRKSRSRHV